MSSPSSNRVPLWVNPAFLNSWGVPRVPIQPSYEVVDFFVITEERNEHSWDMKIDFGYFEPREITYKMSGSRIHVSGKVFDWNEKNHDFEKPFTVIFEKPMNTEEHGIAFMPKQTVVIVRFDKV